MDGRGLLSQPHLTVVSGEPDAELRQIAQIVTHSVTVDGPVALERLLGGLLAEVGRSGAVTPKTLDLIGHTRSHASVLTLGDWLIDVANPTVAACFRGLADRRVLPRLGVHAVRLLGCNSAGTAHGRATICELGDLLELEVYGSKQLLSPAHYGAAGFRDCWSFLLVAARELRRGAHGAGVVPAGAPRRRRLDFDALPAVALSSCVGRGPRRRADAQAARQILQLVRRGDGAPMPGLVTAPSYELALPLAAPGAYHVVEVLFDGEFLRFYPDGMTATGIVFPVDDAGALRRVVDGLPPAPELTR